MPLTTKHVSHRAAVGLASAKRYAADADWRNAIRAARDNGLSMREIAEAAGVSRQRIHQILNGQ